MATETTKTKPVTASLSVELHAKLRIACFRQGVTMAKFIESVIEDSLADSVPVE
jgi:hypothetical protein